MQRVLLQLLGVVFISLTVLMSACTDDSTGIPDNPLPPVSSLVAGTGLVSDDTEVEAGGFFKVQLKVQKGTAQLKSVTLYEEATKLTTDRFTINSGAITSNNPFLIVGTAKEGAVYEIEIEVHGGFKETRTYTFEIEDEDGLKDEVSVDITTKGEAVSSLTGKLLLNQAGPAGQGGLDLDTGDSVGSILGTTGNPAIDTSFKRAEINDEGIDTNKPLASNWLQQISGTNGAEVRYIGGAMPENFNFDNVQFKEEIVAAFDTGKVFTAKDATGELISNPIKVGDVFTVKRGNKYYIIKVTKVTITPSDNQDSYEFSIKK